MAKCKFCGKHVVSGSVVHDECLPRWIPVTERLPEHTKKVLVYRPDMVIDYAVTRYDKYLGWINYDVSMRGEHTITHWMPLPTPPMEVDHD